MLLLMPGARKGTVCGFPSIKFSCHSKCNILLSRKLSTPIVRSPSSAILLATEILRGPLQRVWVATTALSGQEEKRLARGWISEAE